MPRKDAKLIDTTDLLETWMLRRKGLAAQFTQDSLREFAAQMNAITRQVMNQVGTTDQEFWSAWIEIGQNASTMAANAKLIVNKQDRTNL